MIILHSDSLRGARACQRTGLPPSWSCSAEIFRKSHRCAARFMHRGQPFEVIFALEVLVRYLTHRTVVQPVLLRRDLEELSPLALLMHFIEGSLLK